MRRLLRRWAVAPRSSCPAAYFEHMIFADENRCNHQQEFLNDPAYRKFSGDCSWNPNLVALTTLTGMDTADEMMELTLASIAGFISYSSTGFSVDVQTAATGPTTLTADVYVQGLII